MNQRGVLRWAAACSVAVVACAVAAAGCAPRAAEPTHSSGDAAAATGGVHGGSLIKAVIVNYLRAGTKQPALRKEQELEWSVFGLLPLFEGFNDQESLKTLVDLEAYYLGEAPGEVLDCLLVRKGESVIKLLSELKMNGSQRCREQLGSKSTACRSDDELRREVDILIKRIGAKEACDIEP